VDTARGPGQRAGLTPAAVLAAAREVLAETGAAGLTMRAVASRLQVAPNALYSHVRSKTDLLDALLDDLLAEVRPPSSRLEDPVAGLTTLMTSSYTVLIGHPDLVPLYLTRQGARGPNAIRLGEVTDALLARAGVPEASIPDARRVLIVHAIGSAAFATAAPDSERPMSTRESRRHFTQSLHWLLTGITHETPRARASD
jgi:TetR/AcrR family transcriptional regulator, tetracycline repressor protein